jgi:hypothetical protein
MTVGQLVAETLALKRTLECEHEWDKYSDTEEQCKHCKAIVTPRGKEHLRKVAERNKRRG